jgi:hypothetical protein
MRAEAFAEVLDGLSKRSAAVIIIGLGGNGKTSLAREIADSCLKGEDGQALFDAAVWVSDKDRPGTTNLSILLDEIARTLDYPGFTQFEHDEKRREVEQLLRRQRVLVCIDNFETITDGALLAWLLNLPEPSKVLITTREYRREYRRGGWPVELRGMSDSEARALISERLKVLRIEKLVSNLAQIEPLVASTSGNPKTIEMALGLVKYERRPLQEVVYDLYAARGELFDDLFARAWSLLDEAARRILMVMTFVQASASREAIRATADVQGFILDLSLDRLSDMALIDVQQDGVGSDTRYMIHPLVRSFAKRKLGTNLLFQKPAYERWISWHLGLVEGFYTYRQHRNKVELLDAELGLLINDLIPYDNEHETLYILAESLYAQQRYDEVFRITYALEYYYYLRGIWDKKLKVNLLYINAAGDLGELQEMVKMLAYQVQLLSKQGESEEAFVFLERLENTLRALEPEPAIEYCIQHARALYFWSQQHWSQAKSAWEASLAAPHKPPKHAIVAHYLWIAACIYKMGALFDAKAMLEYVVQEAVGSNYPRICMVARCFLAAIHLDHQEAAAAEEDIEWILCEAQSHLDREVTAMAKALSARLYLIKGEHELAYVNLAEAIDLFERLGMRRELAEAREELRRLDELGEASVA